MKDARHFGFEFIITLYTLHTHTPDSKTHVKYTHTRRHMLHMKSETMALHARVSTGMARSSEAHSSWCEFEGELVGQAARVSVWVQVLEPLAPLAER